MERQRQHFNSIASPSATAPSRRCPTCPSTSSPARCSGSSGLTARARRRRFACCAGCCTPTAERCASWATTRCASTPRSRAPSGYLSQRFSLYGDLSIDENIAFFAEIHDLWRYDDRRRRLLELTQPAAVPVAPGRPAVGRDEAEAGAGLHAHPRAARDPARRADHRRRPGLEARILEAAGRVPRAGHHDPRQHAVPRRGRALPPGRAAARGTAALARHP